MLVLWIRYERSRLVAIHLDRHEPLVHGWLFLTSFRRLIVPICLGMIGAGWVGYYNYRVTGSPFRLPYLCYEQQYALTPMFLSQPLRESPGFQNEPMREFHEDWEVGISF
jgi:hypothetical protein